MGGQVLRRRLAFHGRFSAKAFSRALARLRFDGLPLPGQNRVAASQAGENTLGRRGAVARLILAIKHYSQSRRRDATTARGRLPPDD